MLATIPLTMSSAATATFAALPLTTLPFTTLTFGALALAALPLVTLTLSARSLAALPFATLATIAPASVAAATLAAPLFSVATSLLAVVRTLFALPWFLFGRGRTCRPGLGRLTAPGRRGRRRGRRFVGLVGGAQIERQMIPGGRRPIGWRSSRRRALWLGGGRRGTGSRGWVGPAGLDT